MAMLKNYEKSPTSTHHRNTSATPGVSTVFCGLRKMVDVELNLCFGILPSLGLGGEGEAGEEFDVSLVIWGLNAGSFKSSNNH